MAWTTPNILTLCRIATAPVLVYLLLLPGPTAAGVAATIFFLASITDFLDGYIARNYGSGTTLGKFLDPLADKVVVISALIMLAGTPQLPRVPAWMVAVLVIREIMVTGLRAIAAAEGVVILYGRGAYTPKAYQNRIAGQVRQLAEKYGIGRPRPGFGHGTLPSRSATAKHPAAMLSPQVLNASESLKPPEVPTQHRRSPAPPEQLTLL